MRRAISIILCTGVLFVLCVMAKAKATDPVELTGWEKKSCIEQNQVYEAFLTSLYQKSIFEDIENKKIDNVEIYYIQRFPELGNEIAFLVESSNEENQKSYQYLLYETSFDIKDKQKVIRNKTFNKREDVISYSEKIKDYREMWEKSTCYVKNPIYYDMVLQLLSSSQSDWIDENYNNHTGVTDLYMKEIKQINKQCDRYAIRFTFVTYEGDHNPPYHKNDICIEITSNPFNYKTLQFVHKKCDAIS